MRGRGSCGVGAAAGARLSSYGGGGAFGCNRFQNHWTQSMSCRSQKSRVESTVKQITIIAGTRRVSLQIRKRLTKFRRSALIRCHSLTDFAVEHSTPIGLTARRPCARRRVTMSSARSKLIPSFSHSSPRSINMLGYVLAASSIIFSSSGSQTIDSPNLPTLSKQNAANESNEFATPRPVGRQVQTVKYHHRRTSWVIPAGGLHQGRSITYRIGPGTPFGEWAGQAKGPAQPAP